MKAVVLAGGRGERLRPITDTRPKPLVPVLARPVMDYILSLLSHHGFDRAFVTTHYYAEQIRERYGERAFGLEISYLEETVPLGTCGGVKLLEKELKDETDFLVISGDSVCDFDLEKTIRFHRDKQADVTVVLSGVETPLEYGVVPLDETGRVTGFAEKPDWSETLSEWVNTGVYVLSPRVLGKVPLGQKFDFAGDLFPLLLKEGFRLFGYKAEGYWCDIGKLSSFYRCNRDLLAGKVKTYLPPSGRKVLSPDGISFVSAGARAEEGAGLSQNNILSPGVTVGKGARLSDSILMENASVGEGCVVKGAILCENTRLAPESFVLPDSVVGAGSVLEKGAVLPEGTRLPPESRAGARAPFEEEELSFTEAGTTRGKEGLDDEGIAELARRAAAFFPGKIAVASRPGDPHAAAGASLLESVMVQNGAEVLSFGSLPREAASFAAGEMGVPLFFAVRFGEKISFFGHEADSLPFFRSTAAALSRPAKDKKKQSGFLWRVPDAEERYAAYLSGLIGKKEGAVGIGGDARSAVFRRAVLKSGLVPYDDLGRARCEIVFGEPETFIRLDGEKINPDRAKLFVCLSKLRAGKRRFAVPEKESPVLQQFLREQGCTILPFSLAHTARDEKEVRKSAAESTRFFWDEAALCAEVLSLVDFQQIEETVRQFAALPRWYRKTVQYLPRAENRAKIIPGALELENDRVRVLPGAFAIRIFSEAFSAEAAEDQAEQIRGKLNEIEKNLGR